jgi:hypothetical protein
MKLSSILPGFRRPPAEATAAELRATLADAEAQLTAAREAMTERAAEHGDALLSPEPGAAAKHEQVMRDAVADVTRLRAMIAALQARIEAADAREAEAALRTEVAEVESMAAAAAEDVKAYASAARGIFETLGRIGVATKRAKALNDRLRAAGRTELQVTPPFNRVWPHSHMEVGGPSLRGPRRLSSTLKGFEADIAEVPRPVVHAVQKSPREQENEALSAAGLRRFATIELLR